MGKILSSEFALGWDALSQTHNSAKAKRVIMGSAYGYLMQSGDTLTRRFAATVLDSIRFCENKSFPTSFSIGGLDASLTARASNEINHLHRKLKEEIYSKHLCKPFMSERELADYLLEETLKQDQSLYELIFGRNKQQA